MLYKRDKIGDHEDWKDGHAAFRQNAVSAIKELNQLGGLSINRSQNININANLEKMSKEQIRERLGKLFGTDSQTYDDKDV